MMCFNLMVNRQYVWDGCSRQGYTCEHWGILAGVHVENSTLKGTYNCSYGYDCHSEEKPEFDPCPPGRIIAYSKIFEEQKCEATSSGGAEQLSCFDPPGFQEAWYFVPGRLYYYCKAEETTIQPLYCWVGPFGIGNEPECEDINYVSLVTDSDNYSPQELNKGETYSVSVEYGVLSNDLGTQLTVHLAEEPSFGDLTLNSDGSFSYTLVDNATSDSFKYQVRDILNLLSIQQSVSINIPSTTPVPQNPVALGDSFGGEQSKSPLVVDAPGVLWNDYDPENDMLTADLISLPNDGSLDLKDDGSFTYEYSADYTGIDSFEYRARDTQGNYSDPATVWISIHPGALPQANGDEYEVNKGKTLSIDKPGVLSNDWHPEGLDITAYLSSGTSNGSLTLNSDGSFVYTPNTNFTGTDSFKYYVKDVNGARSLHTPKVVIYVIVDCFDLTKAKYNPYNGHYYQQYGDPFKYDNQEWVRDKKWEEAKSYCVSLGGYLATISSEEENTFIRTHVACPYECHIGGYQPPGSLEPYGSWTWVTGEPWYYDNWHPGEPNDGGLGDAENYLGFNTGLGLYGWNDVKNVNNPFICEWGATKYNPANDHYYHRFHYPFDKDAIWTTAKRCCNDLDGYLATISSEDEYNFILNEVASSYECSIGGTDERVEGTWRWITDEHWYYDYWKPGEPNDGGLGDSENYLTFTKEGFADVGNNNNPFICEWGEYTIGIYNPANRHYYQQYGDPFTLNDKTWGDAKSHCESLGGYLATISSEEENTFIRTHVACPYECHIGGYQPPGSLEPYGSWTWVTGEPWYYENWYPGEPNDGGLGDAENYLTFNTGLGLYGWNDFKDVSNPYICEWGVSDNTPIGSYVEVSIYDHNITFDTVTIKGFTSITESPSGPELPQTFLQSCTPPQYFNIQTTALYSGNTEICLSYDDTICDETGLHLLHYEGGTWLDVTNSVDTVNNIICGNVSILLPFVLAHPANQPPVAQCLDVKVSADANCQGSANVDNCSYDPDGDSISLDQAPPGPYCFGTTEVTLTVTDDKGAFDTCVTTVTVVDGKAPPTCQATLINPGYGEIRVRDDGGLAEINIVRDRNAEVVIPSFTSGTTDPVVVTASKIIPGESWSVLIEAIDVDGNAITCDPVFTLQVREKGKPVSVTLSETDGFLPQDIYVSVKNGDPGIKNLEIIVNDEKFKVTGLGDDEETTIYILSAMMEEDNSITLTAKGKPNTSAEVVIHDGTFQF